MHATKSAQCKLSEPIAGGGGRSPAPPHRDVCSPLREVICSRRQPPSGAYRFLALHVRPCGESSSLAPAPNPAHMPVSSPLDIASHSLRTVECRSINDVLCRSYFHRFESPAIPQHVLRLQTSARHSRPSDIDKFICLYVI